MVISAKKLTKVYRNYGSGEGLLKIARNIVLREYEEVYAIRPLSFDMEPGTCVGLLGSNGAGKTTIVKMLCGLLVPTAGEAKVLDFVPWERRPEFLSQIGVVMGQRQQLWIDVSAHENLRMIQVIYEIADDVFKTRLKRLSKMLEVQDLLHFPIRKLSLGEKMKMELLAAFIHAPKVLFLDEPSLGLDLVAQNAMREFIKARIIEDGVSVLLTSHYLKDLEELCSRVLMIQKGKIVHDGSLHELSGVLSQMKRVIWAERGNIDQEAKDTLEELRAQSLGDGRYFLEVLSKDVPAVVRKLVKSSCVEDLTIESPPIEDSVRLILQKAQKG